MIPGDSFCVGGFCDQLFVLRNPWKNMFVKAKKLSEEDFEKMDDQADDEWKQDELQEPEPETQALEVPGEGYQEDEFEEVFEELEEAQQAPEWQASAFHNMNQCRT